MHVHLQIQTRPLVRVKSLLSSPTVSEDDTQPFFLSVCSHAKASYLCSRIQRVRQLIAARYGLQTDRAVYEPQLPSSDCDRSTDPIGAYTLAEYVATDLVQHEVSAYWLSALSCGQDRAYVGLPYTPLPVGGIGLRLCILPHIYTDGAYPYVGV